MADANEGYNNDVISQLVELQYGTRNECILASYHCFNFNDINQVMDKLDEMRENNSNNIDLQTDKQYLNKSIDIDNIDSEEYVNEIGKYDLTFGYIRELEERLNLYSIIPQEIKQMIHAFKLCDTWDYIYSSKDLIIKSDSIKKLDTRTLCVAFGASIIKKKMKHNWWLRIKSSSDKYTKYIGYFAYIGIIKDYEVEEDLGTVWKNNGTGYAFNCGNAQIVLHHHGSLGYTQYAVPFTKPGQIMQITLNLQKKTLSFGIDGKQYGKAFKNIKRDSYVLVVSISNMVKNFELEFL